ncbi:MAG: hypothetical protein KC422_18640 [Trueperaceae bacterium]|nr:hypothetical protein [Trueperaceae bacterium]
MNNNWHMRTSGQELRERLFRFYSKNLEIVVPGFTDTFVCPICLKHFSFEDSRGTNKLTPHLSLAHIWSKYLGFKQVSLSCTNCNNTIGSSFEAYEKAHIESGSDKNSYKNVFIGLPGSNERVKVDLNILQKDDGKVVIKFDPKGGSQRLENQLFDAKTLQISVLIPKFDERKANLAYLHSAHMLMFHTFGYSYILSPFGNLIINQLNYPKKEIFPVLASSYSGNVANDPDTGREINIYLVPSPQQQSGFVIISPKIAKLENLRKRIYIPIDKEQFLNQKAREIEVEGIPIRDLNYLLNEDIAKDLVFTVLNSVFRNQGLNYRIRTKNFTQKVDG